MVCVGRACRRALSFCEMAVRGCVTQARSLPLPSAEPRTMSSDQAVCHERGQQTTAGHTALQLRHHGPGSPPQDRLVKPLHGLDPEALSSLILCRVGSLLCIMNTRDPLNSSSGPVGLSASFNRDSSCFVVCLGDGFRGILMCLSKGSCSLLTKIVYKSEECELNAAQGTPPPLSSTNPSTYAQARCCSQQRRAIRLLRPTG